MILFNKLNRIYPEASLGTQRRTIINVDDSLKGVVKGVVSENDIKLAADKMAADMIEVVKKPKILDNGAKPLDTSPDVSEWFAPSLFSLETTEDCIVAIFIVLSITLIIMFCIKYAKKTR